MDQDPFQTHLPPPVLVTGTPYSGTTWIGQQLAEVCDLAYVHEPFNFASRGAKEFGVSFDSHWVYLDDEIAERHRSYLGRLLRLEPATRSGGSLLVALLTRASRMQRRRGRESCRHARPLWKDPLAMLSVGWLAKRLHARVVLCVRPPVLFAASHLRRARWRPGSCNAKAMLEQPVFMKRHGWRFATEIESMACGTMAPHLEAAWFWRILNEVACDQLADSPHGVLQVIDYERIVERPAAGFTRIAEALSLPAGQRAINLISRSMTKHAHAGRMGEAFDPTIAASAALSALSPGIVEEIEEVTRPTRHRLRELIGDGDEVACVNQAG